MTTTRKRKSKTQLADTPATDYKSEYVEDGRRLAGKHGRRRVQACRSRADLPQIHIRRIRRGLCKELELENGTRAPTLRTRTNTERKASSGCRPRLRWQYLKNQTRQPTIGRSVDDAMTAIERDNPVLKDVLPKDYARPALDKGAPGAGRRPMVSNIKVGGAEARATDVLGNVYEYFLEQFALGRGSQGRRVLHTSLGGPVACGDAGALQRTGLRSLLWIFGDVRSVCMSSSRHTLAETGMAAGPGVISPSIGQESNYTTWRMARMNLAIRGIEGKIEHGDSFNNDRHPDLRADYILANPPFNVSDWGGERLRDDKRWEYGAPPVGNANFAWVQHFLYHLAPRGTAGFVLANGSMSSNQSGEGEIRKSIIEAGLVDCIIALPGQLFRSTQIPACLWFLSRGRSGGGRQRETLFIDVRQMGHMLDRTRRDLSSEDIARVADTYHAWLRKSGSDEYADVPGFCKSATLEEMRKHGHVLTPRPLCRGGAAEGRWRFLSRRR